MLRLIESDTGPRAAEETVTVLECAIDDMTGEELAELGEHVFAAGALDVVTTPVIMKQGRPAVSIQVLGRPADQDALVAALFSASSTIGLRVRQERRIVLPRSEKTITVDGEPVRIKESHYGGRSHTRKAESRDIRELARKSGRSMRAARQRVGEVMHETD
jgi:pyridinium-3,5-bisthiocarboxylic acid mononucleotide nickel chelatase